MRRFLIAALAVGVVVLIASSALARPSPQQDCASAPCTYLPIVAKPLPPTETPTTMPTDTPEPSPSVTPTEWPGLPAFKNPGFELGHSDWIEIPDHEIILIAAPFSGLTAHSGQWLAHLGGENNSADEIQQTITLPAAPVYLRYYYQVRSTEVGGFDELNVLVNADTVYLIGFGSGDDTPDWEAKTVDLSAYAGQTVVIRFRIYLDADDPSDVYLDDISLSSHP